MQPDVPPVLKGLEHGSLVGPKHGKEPAPAKGAVVERNGVTLTDDALQKAFDDYMSTGTRNILRSRVESGAQR